MQIRSEMIVHGLLDRVPLPRRLTTLAAFLAACGFLAAGLLGGAPPAAAQQGFGNFFGYQTQQRPKRRAVRRRRRATKPATDENEKKKEVTEKAPTGPAFVVVSLADQKVSVYDATGRIAQSRVSTGTRSHPTPTGVFSVIGKRRHHYSNLYAGAPMPWMQRITWSGVAMHAGHVTGRPASHGCIRLPYSFAPKMWKLTKMGARVMVARRHTTPVEIAHDFLPRPTMQAEPGAAARQQASKAPASPIELASMGPPTHVAARTETSGPAALDPIAYARALKEHAKASKAAADAAAKDALAAAQAAGAEARRAEADVRKGIDDMRKAKARLSTAESDLSEAKTALTAAQADVETARAKAAELAAQVVPLPVASSADKKTTAKVEAITAEAEKDAAAAQKAADRAQEALAAAKQRAERAATARTAAKSEQIRARAALEMARTREARTTPASFAAVKTWKDAVAASKDAARTLKEAGRRIEPVSVFVSRKEGRVFVRQDWKEVYEAPVTIRDPDQPLGTHVYIAVAAEPDGSSMRWSAITMPEKQATDTGKSAKAKAKPVLPVAKADAAEAPLPQVEQKKMKPAAAAALDRIEMPQEARRRISELLWTGASLIVSDHGRSHEMGEYTDFIVLTR